MAKFHDVDILRHLKGLAEQIKKMPNTEDIVNARKRDKNFPSLTTVLCHFNSLDHLHRMIQVEMGQGELF